MHVRVRSTNIFILSIYGTGCQRYFFNVYEMFFSNVFFLAVYFSTRDRVRASKSEDK